MWWERLPELAPYRDEPKQLASGVAGKDGALELRFAPNGDRTNLVELYRRAPLLVQKALYWDVAMPGLPCVMIITTSGCILQGDRYRIKIELADSAQAHITTQAATKIHSMDANFAAQTQDIVVGENAYLELIPDTVIPHAHARFVTHTQLAVHPTATVFYSEILLGGRKYYKQGELFQFDLFSSLVTGRRPDGTTLFTEKFVISPAQQAVRRAGMMGPFDVFGNVLVLTPKDQSEAILAQTPALYNQEECWMAGASRLPNDAGIIYKVVGTQSEQVKRIVRNFLAVVRQQVTGNSLPPAFHWQ
ncbi:MAG: urease accessory protein UreD [Caldilineaceae bacterium]